MSLFHEQLEALSASPASTKNACDSSRTNLLGCAGAEISAFSSVFHGCLPARLVCVTARSIYTTLTGPILIELNFFEPFFYCEAYSHSDKHAELELSKVKYENESQECLSICFTSVSFNYISN